MLDIGWSELILIAIVALVLFGPAELVVLMRKAGYWVQKARLQLVSIQRMVEAAAYEEEIRRMREELGTLKQEAAGLPPVPQGKGVDPAVNPTGASGGDAGVAKVQATSSSASASGSPDSSPVGSPSASASSS